jgi:zinc transport system ATP-binding protein
LSYIDKRFESRLYKIIERLAKTTTIVLVSHEMSTLGAMANRHFIVDVNLHECSAHHHFIRTDCDD